uniref:Polynucleotide 5'-hydroxyl-kinase NOL9 n=1 Tax=Acrobeloides nanus TaxID=290746 RepID=A0A914EN46_9BILA
MQLLRNYVDSSLHKLEQNCIAVDEKDLIRPITKTNSAVDNAHSLRPNDPPSLVYSKKVSSVSSSPSAYHSEASASSSNTFTGLQNTPSVKYAEILAATNDFSSDKILGKGGYGTVYKGYWKLTDVAIKRLLTKKDGGSEHEKERLRQSLQELRTLAKFRHDNILALYGYSMDGPEPCLVYQFMANGSLEDRLLCRKGTSPLTWAEKFNIAYGTSCGLHFLHSIGNAPIIHGDVKSANILLDKHMEPKLGDFGLCRDGQVEADAQEKSPLIASHIKGTLAYLPPEFITSKILSTKLDVYSFGVVLLELATANLDSLWDIIEALSHMSSPTPKPYRCSDPDLILAVIHPEKPFVLGGAFQIQCLYGTVELNGYVLKAAAYEEERFLPVVLPKATHIPIDIRAHYLTEQLKMDRLKWRVKEVSVAFEDVCAAFQNEEYSAVVLISSKPPVVARFLVNLFDEEFFRPADNLYENEKWRHHCYIIKNEFPVYLYTPSFQEQYDKVFYRIEDMLKGIKNVVVMVVGNKGVGKSTLIRNLINRLISLDAMPPLYLLDGDVGQSEKNPSGCISLFRILNHKPLLGAPTSHQEKCLHSSYFFGSNTPATNMGLYVNVMQHLTKEYIANCPENKNSILIVNTLGWIEDEGNNLMMNVISNIEPTLIINLKSHQRNVANFQIPLQLSERTVELIALPRANENITRQNNSADLRQWLYFGYFAHTLTAGRIYYNYLSENCPKFKID